MEGWSDFFVAEVGAAAALAGLLVVAVTINVERILKYPLLPGRAAETIIIVGAALVVGCLGLFPRQPPVWFGLEALAAGLFVGATGLWHLRAAILRRNAGDPLTWTLVPLIVLALAVLPTVVGGILLIGGDEAGMYWIAVGLILSFVATLQNGWVLLIEILR
jgi:modulator of FtsH protease